MPKLKKNQALLDQVITLRVTAQTRADWKLRAQASGLPLGDWIREQVSSYTALEQVVQTELSRFKRNIHKQFNDANASISANMAELKRKSYLYQAKPWMFLLAFSLLVIPCLVIGLYWTNNYLDTTIRHKLATLEKHNQALKALGDVKMEHQMQDGNLYLITPNNKKPLVYQVEHYPGHWIIKIEG